MHNPDPCSLEGPATVFIGKIQIRRQESHQLRCRLYRYSNKGQILTATCVVENQNAVARPGRRNSFTEQTFQSLLDDIEGYDRLVDHWIDSLLAAFEAGP